jgi:hypothetical protein
VEPLNTNKFPIIKICFIIVAALVGLLVSRSARAQDTLVVLSPNIKFSPLHLLSNTIQIGYEHKVAKRFTVQLEAGYVLRNGFINSDDKNRRGARFKEDIRYYYRVNTRKEKALYMAVELLQNYIHLDKSGTTSVCDDPQCQTWSTVDLPPYKVKLHEKGMGFKIGVTEMQSRFIFDFSAGLSLRAVTWHRPPGILPEYPGTIGLPLEYFARDERDNTKIFPALGFRVGYVIGNKALTVKKRGASD